MTDHAGEIDVGIVGTKVTGSRVVALDFGPTPFIGFARRLGDRQFHMWQGVGQVGEERPIAMVADELQGLLMDLVGRSQRAC